MVRRSSENANAVPYREATSGRLPGADLQHLPERWQLRGVDHLEGIGLHLHQAVGRDPDADALALGQLQHALRLVGIDDLRTGVPHLVATLELLGHHLDAAHIRAGIEDLAAVDHRVRHCLQVGHVAAFDAMPSTASRSPPAPLRMSRRIVTVLSTGPRSIWAVVAPDVAVAQQSAPAAAKLRGIFLRRIRQLSNVPQNRVSHPRRATYG